MLDKKHFEEQWAGNEEKLIRKAIHPFPEYFGLRAFPGKLFTIMESACYVSGGQVYLYAFIKNANGWESFCKGTQGELLSQVVIFPELDYIVRELPANVAQAAINEWEGQ